MPLDPLDLAATPERLHALARAGVLTPAGLARASRLAVATPEPAAWRRFLSTALLGFGSLLVLSGVIYFFAYNWQALHRFGKLGLVLAAIAGACVAAWRLGEGLAGQFALLFAAVLVGPLLAIYGQAYQTGADAYGLFLGWSVLILPWVALARLSPLWLLLLVLVDTTLSLYGDQTGPEHFERFVFMIALVNGAAWVAHEVFARRGASWLQGRWLPRVLALMTLSPLLGLAEEVALGISEGHGYAVSYVALGLLVGFMGAGYAYHRLVRPELFLLSLNVLCAMTLVTSWMGRLLLDTPEFIDSFLGFFVLALLVVAQVGLAVWWLRAEARRAEEE